MAFGSGGGVRGWAGSSRVDNDRGQGGLGYGLNPRGRKGFGDLAAPTLSDMWAKQSQLWQDL